MLFTAGGDGSVEHLVDFFAVGHMDGQAYFGDLFRVGDVARCSDRPHTAAQPATISNSQKVKTDLRFVQ